MVVLLLLAILYSVMDSGIKKVSSIPAVFEGQEIKYEYIYGMTFIKGEQVVNYPITHDDQALYVLNGAGDDIKKFYIDKDAGELVIRKNIVSPKQRNKAYFQVVKVPKSQYEDIVFYGKVKLRIQYMYLDRQSTLLEYDFNSKETNVVSHTVVGK